MHEEDRGDAIITRVTLNSNPCHIPLNIFTHVQSHWHTCALAYTHVSAHTHTLLSRARTHTHTHTHTHAHAHARTHTLSLTHTCTYTHTHINAHTHIHTHTLTYTYEHIRQVDSHVKDTGLGFAAFRTWDTGRLAAVYTRLLCALHRRTRTHTYLPSVVRLAAPAPAPPGPPLRYVCLLSPTRWRNGGPFFFGFCL